MTEYQKIFQETGYLIVENFFTSEIVRKAREESETLFNADQDNTLKPTTFLQNTFLSDVIMSDSFLNILKELSNSYQFFIPNFTVRRDLYINWHSDDEFVDPDYGDLPGVLQCNIYLQDNCVNHGGGIDVSCGTQRLSQEIKKCSIQKNEVLGTTTKTKAGDLLIFDYRAIHRSTIPQISPRKESRLAIQWTVCKSIDHALAFFRYLLRRLEQKLHLSDFTDKRSLSYFQDIKNLSVSISCVSNYIEKLKQKNCYLVTFKDLEKFGDCCA